MISGIDDITHESTFLSSSFDEPILYAPARTERLSSCSSLKIVTAFTDTERISTHMIHLGEGMRAKRFVPGIKGRYNSWDDKNKSFAEKACGYLQNATFYQ